MQTKAKFKEAFHFSPEEFRFFNTSIVKPSAIFVCKIFLADSIDW